MNFDIRNCLTPKRVTNAMWDYSWLVGHYPGGAFENFDKATDELLERSFNAVRIDCFPWIAGNIKSVDEVVTIEGSPLANWGVSDKNYRHCIIGELVEFLTVCKRKGIFVILSNWWYLCKEYSISPSTLGFNNAQKIFIKGWELVLEVLSQHDLLDIILYVDLDQEFPFFSFTQERLNVLSTNEREKIISTGGENAMEYAGLRKNTRDLKWNEPQLDFVSDHFTSMLAHFQRIYPQLRFTFSITEYWNEIRALKMTSFDILELHFWIHSPRFENRTGFTTMPKDRGERDYKDYQLRLDRTLHSIRPMLIKEMENRLAYAADWGREMAAPVITTESWGSWWHMDHSDLKWEWLYDWCAECMRMAADFGLWGVTPWNYAHPYWKNWENIKWYKKVNDAFLNS